MPTISDCPVCSPNSPLKDDKPWPIWEHRTLAELFTRAGRARWHERRRFIEVVHDGLGEEN